MTTDDVKKRVNYVRSASDHPETAHLREDQLHQDVLRKIATDPSISSATMAELAAEALKTLSIVYGRVYFSTPK